jgi:hypothetical protein
MSTEGVLTFHEISYTGGPYSAKVVGVTPFGEKVEKTITIEDSQCGPQTIVLNTDHAYSVFLASTGS